MQFRLEDCVTLLDGRKMPRFGLGVWQAQDGEEVENAIKSAVSLGYRSIDTAMGYGNEVGVGKAVRECGVSRDKLFVTTKLWNADQGYDTTIAACKDSLERLGMEYVDLYLMHWPCPGLGKYVDSWKALIEIQKRGWARSIGVCNFLPEHLEKIIEETGVKPVVNQVELHPYLSQKPLIDFCREKGIQVEAYSPLMHGNLKEVTDLEEIARKYGKTKAQVTLRWHLQNGLVVIPKSVHKERIAENCDIFDFELTAEEMAKIDGMNQDKRFLPNPLEFNYVGTP